MGLNTSIIPQRRLDVHYAPGNMVKDVTGLIIIMRSDWSWTSLLDQHDGTWFLESDGQWYRIVPQRINEHYTNAVKLPINQRS